MRTLSAMPVSPTFIPRTFTSHPAPEISSFRPPELYQQNNRCVPREECIEPEEIDVIVSRVWLRGPRGQLHTALTNLQNARTEARSVCLKDRLWYPIQVRSCSLRRGAVNCLAQCVAWYLLPQPQFLLEAMHFKRAEFHACSSIQSQADLPSSRILQSV